MRKWLFRIGIFILLAIVFPLAGGLTIAYDEWSGMKERRYQLTGSSGQAPLPEEHEAAIVQVYAARAARWRGIFGVHTWIAYKKAGASEYRRTEVIGWGARYRETVVYDRNGIPDRYWYGYEPELLADIRGQQAETAIARIEELAPRTIPYRGSVIEAQPYRLTGKDLQLEVFYADDRWVGLESIVEGGRILRYETI